MTHQKLTMKYIYLGLISFLLASNLHAQIVAPSYYFNVLSPFQVSGSWDNTQFGNIGTDWGWDGQVLDIIAGELVYADPNQNGQRMGCDETATDYTGKFVFVDRGLCEFSEKAFRAQEQGAIGLIINNLDDQISNMAAGTFGAQVNIPVIHLPLNLGSPLAEELLLGETIVVSLSPDSMQGGILRGTVSIDGNDNCINENGEQLGSQIKVQVQSMGKSRTTLSNAQGEYLFGLPPGDYEVSANPNSDIWEACPAVQVTLEEDTSVEQDLQFSASQLCPDLSVELSTARLRRCFDNNDYYVNYCNQGSIEQEDSYIIVTLDEHLALTSASETFTEEAENVYRFDLGTLDVLECGRIIITVEVLCDVTMLGQTLCSTAEIFPFSRGCLNAGLWTEVDVRAAANCQADEEVILNLENRGISNMPEQLNYIIIRDDEQIDEGTYSLLAGESISFSYPADGSTYRIQSDPIDYDTHIALPAAGIEACVPDNEDFSTGFINFYLTGDYGGQHAADCTEVIGAYDPNDKAANIAGYGPKHYIEQNVPLKYKIRFQNTGTDTAFTVVLIDTLSEHLNLRTLKPIASSHNYELTLTENILTLNYPNILLPDSTTNEPASNGFFEFEISQLPNVELESEITNRAGIYFDFNEPVITNTVMHTVGKDFLNGSTSTQDILVEGVVLMYPNPLKDILSIEIREEVYLPSNLKIFNTSGNLIQQFKLNESKQTIELDTEDSGMYFYKIEHNGVSVAEGKIVKL